MNFIISIETTTVVNDAVDFIHDSAGQWEAYTVDLSAFAGQTVTVRLRTVQAADVYLDDIGLVSSP